MANVSRWKDFEKQVATALGGKRRFRTTESYGKTADDVKFPKDLRRRFPKLKTVAIECKKRKNLNVHALFAEAKDKYCKTGKHLIFASKVTHKRNLKKRLVALKNKLEKNQKKILTRKLDKLNRKRIKAGKKPLDKRESVRMAIRLIKETREKYLLKEKQLRLKHDITALVTVDLEFFKELWEHWVFGRKFTPQELRNA